MITIIQGESFPIPVLLQKGSKNLGPQDVEDLQIGVAGIHKKYSTAGLRYDDASGRWIFHPSQDDTLGAAAGIHALQVQIKYAGGTVRKIAGPYVTIQESQFKEKI